MKKPITVYPKVTPNGARAIRWVWLDAKETRSNYREVLDFMGCDHGEGEPDLLVDAHGKEFSVGCWVVHVNGGTSYTDDEFWDAWKK